MTEIIVAGPQGVVNVLSAGSGRVPEQPAAPAVVSAPKPAAGTADWA